MNFDRVEEIFLDYFSGEDEKTFRVSYFFIVQFEISSSGHMRANNQRLRVRGRFIYGGREGRERVAREILAT